MYNKVSTGMNFVEREKEVEKFWKDKDIFRKSIKLREGHQRICFTMDRQLRTENRILVMC